MGWLSSSRPRGRRSCGCTFDAHHPHPTPETAVLFPDEPYQAEVAFADMQVGRLLNAMRRIDPALAHTLVVVVADHGESMGAHGEALHGVLLYDETVAIPMLMRRRAGSPPAGSSRRRPASSTSRPPSWPSPAPPADGLDGADLSGWLEPSPAPPASAQDRGSTSRAYGWHHYGWAPSGRSGRRIQAHRQHHAGALRPRRPSRGRRPRGRAAPAGGPDAGAHLRPERHHGSPRGRRRRGGPQPGARRPARGPRLRHGGRSRRRRGALARSRARGPRRPPAQPPPHRGGPTSAAAGRPRRSPGPRRGPHRR